MHARAGLRKFVWKWLAPAAGLAALGLALFFYFHTPSDKSYRLRMTAGNALGTRHRLAVSLQGELARRNLTIELVPCRGSEDALDRVNRRELDVALVQGALAPAGRPNVRQVAALHVEPMHLLVKKELYQAASTGLSALRGKTVDLEEVGSGTHSLAVSILAFAGLRPRDEDPAGGYVSVSLDRKQLFDEPSTARLPDAVFLVSSLPSFTAELLVTRHGYRLVPLPFAEAFALSSLAEPSEDSAPGAVPPDVVRGRIQAVTVPAFTYGVEPPVPAQPLPTLGTRLLLVAHKDVPARAAYQLVEGTYAAEFGQVVRPPLDARLMELPPEFPWHDGALLYQQRNAPLLSGQAIDSTRNGFAIFAAAASGLFVLWQWSKERRRLSRSRGFNTYIARVTRIEERVLEAERGRPTAVEELLALRDELSRLKTQALDECAREELAGKELMPGFLAQIHDVRDSLTRLILREGAAVEGRRPLAGRPQAP
jgi:TRAP-type uncharacterized transport system substrate-binding protein